jgi:carboxypeptidase family protein/TonB-dependent receptor-like protein
MKRMVLGWVGLFFFVGIVGHAQVTTGTITGTVSDSSGAVLPGARIALVNEETGITRTVTTDAVGRYAAPSLAVGNYKITVQQEGFQTAVRSGIALTVGRQAVVDFQLQVGAVTQTVEVSGEAPLVETTQSSVSALVDSKSINELPLNGRNLSELVLLQPGVSKLENAAVATHRGYGTQISISGARSDDNLFLLDGTDIADYQNNAPVGPNGIMYGAGSVREFQVLTGNISAQYGRTMGGVFNSVSKSGTNQLHGELFESLRNSATDARNFFDGATIPPFRRNQFGGGVGGPLIRDKTFYHLSYEGLRSVKSNTTVTSVPGAEFRAGIVPLTSTLTSSNCTSRGGTVLTADSKCQFPIQPIAASIIPYWPAPTGGGTAGAVAYTVATPLRVSSDYFQTRMDHQISDKDSIFGRFTYLGLTQESTSATPGYTTDTNNGSRFFTFSHTRIISANDLNTFRVAFNRNTLTEQKITPSLPALKYFADSPWPGNFNVTGIGLGFSIALWPNFYANTNRFELMDDFTMTRGAHSLQFGGNFQRLQANQDFPNIPNGQYSFRTWDGFLTYNPSVPSTTTGVLGPFRGTPPSGTDSVRGLRFWYFSGYIQDDWKIRPNLTLNLGLRYDFGSVEKEVNGKISNFRPLTLGGDFAATSVNVQGDPLYQNPTKKNFAPRLGFAWTPFSGGRTSVRGGVGLFYGRIDARQNWANRDGFIAKGYSVNNPHLFPDAAAEIAASAVGGTPTVQVFNTAFDLQAPHDWQWTFNIQQQLSQSTVITVGYAGNRGINLASIANYDAPETSYIDGVLTAPANGKPRNPLVAIMDLTGSQGDSWYHGMTLDLRRRLSQGWQFQVAYTWSKAMSTADQTSRAQLTSNRVQGYFLDPAHIDADKSLSPWDSRNVFKFNSIYELPFGPRKKWLNEAGIVSQIVGGWRVSGDTTFKSGSPFTYEVQVPTLLSGMTFAEVRPNLKPDVSPRGIILGTPNQTCSGKPCDLYYDPNSFLFPGAGQLGNVGRLTGISPGIAAMDLSLQKSFSLRENVGMEFRASAINITNRSNFGIPNRTVFASTGLPITGPTGTGHITDTTVDSRSMQFDLKLVF